MEEEPSRKGIQRATTTAAEEEKKQPGLIKINIGGVASPGQQEVAIAATTDSPSVEDKQNTTPQERQ